MTIKRRLLLFVVHAATFMAVLGIQPTSWSMWYQPEIPKELKDN